MKISEIYIKNYLQFRDFHLKLTYPDTGKTLDKICFIGANGTGKSNLLKIIRLFLFSINNNTEFNDLLRLNIEGLHSNTGLHSNSLVYFCIKSGLDCIYVLYTNTQKYYFSDNLLEDDSWSKIFNINYDFSNLTGIEWNKLSKKSNQSLINKLTLKHDTSDIVCYSNPDTSSLIKSKSSIPTTELNQALVLFKDLPIYHDISSSNISGFWKILIYQIKKRERDYIKFLESPNSQNLIVSTVKQKFNLKNPDILVKLAEQWNLILERAGLEFDVENAKIPVQLNEKLEAYIRLKNSKKNIPYNNLSTGIRNFIFQLGHIYALYFNRDIKRGFLLIDEPELSLFPDLLYDLIDRYLAIIQNTQFFVATHSPIIAAQFEPAERFILEFDDDGYVNARLGVSPEGDDPNDLLANDFVVRSLYGKKGIEQWERYLYLRRKIVETEDISEKKELLREYSNIGNAYNFLPNEISE